MLRRYHRVAVVWAVVMLAAPMIAGMLRSGDNSAPSEQREGPAPAFPRHESDWLLLPSRIDAYLGLRFGLRADMILARSVLLHLGLREGNADVEVGSDGRLFYRGQDAIRQSAGLLIREPRIAQTANTIASVRAALAAKGVRFVFASPPNGATVYPESLPAWERNDGRPTEYDMLLRALAAHGVPAVDLRPVLQSARKAGMVYLKYDTHWSARGAVASFNAVAAATGHADWQLDPAVVLGPSTRLPDEDLPRMLGIANLLQDETRRLILSPAEREYLESKKFPNPFSSVPKQPGGPKVMVIGDSSTLDFSTMIDTNGGEFSWIFHYSCGFDWTWVERFRPDEVWWMPTERLFLCSPGARPKGLPETSG
jgi:hypothetical protein